MLSNNHLTRQDYQINTRRTSNLWNWTWGNSMEKWHHKHQYHQLQLWTSINTSNVNSLLSSFSVLNQRLCTWTRFTQLLTNNQCTKTTCQCHSHSKGIPREWAQITTQWTIFWIHKIISTWMCKIQKRAPAQTPRDSTSV